MIETTSMGTRNFCQKYPEMYGLKLQIKIDFSEASFLALSCNRQNYENSSRQSDYVHCEGSDDCVILSQSSTSQFVFKPLTEE
ncbi:hypothetical protein CEXT_189201 [Caerostris extrusa]|uniref:Uncharacterized protein n=1 Tax=Caerostris extrusa TaxID=172846 RepID=A0AAV4XE82_CAEEX|nr:hypothetical protein CEXT_189201 [Caerostris extrusa]